MKAEKNKLAEMIALKETEYENKIASLNKEKELFEVEKKNTLAQFEIEKSSIADIREEIESNREIKLREIELEKNVLEIEKDKFEKYKELEEQRLDYENQELSKGCERLKNLVSQFNQEFKKDSIESE